MSVANVLEPGLTLCAVCRARDAVLVEDPGERWQRPLCFECADDVLDRMNAHGIAPAAEEMILGARKELVYRPLPVPVVDWETADHSKLNVLRAQWQAYEAGNARRLAGASRCWAIVPDGSRCVRDEDGQGVCWTHALQGCRIPGLGWDGDKPIGRVIVRQGKVVAA